MSFSTKTFAGVLSLAFALVTSQSWADPAEPAADGGAQDAQGAPSAQSGGDNQPYMEEIVVMGIRSSLRDAIGIKRSNVGTMEAIAAEDFGKFPDCWRPR